MLKCDFHIHTKEDPKDFHEIKYNCYEMIDYAAKKGFEVLAITLHDKLFFNKKIEDYARGKGILLIPGIEPRVENQDFVVLMKKPIYDVEKIKTYEELKRFKEKHKKNILIIAPHLFYPKYLIKMNRRWDVSDAIEHTHFYCKLINPNKKAVELAKKLNKPVIGNSDMHALWQMNRTYTLLDCKKNVDSVFNTIKKNEVSLVTKPYFFRTFFFVMNPIYLLKRFFCPEKKRKGL